MLGLQGALLSLLAAGGLVAAGFGWGHGSAQSGAAKAQATAIANAVKARDAEIERGAKSVASYRAAFDRMAADYLQLKGQFDDVTTRVPLLVPRACRSRPAVTALASAPPGTPAAPGAPAPTAELSTDVATDLVPSGGGGDLSLAAVWMWNSALAGADVRAGACGTADTSTAACAAAAGATVSDAWANHAVNARACAEDRLRYRRLIDHLQGRGAP